MTSDRIKLYQPCNGSEGDWFRAQFCDRCQREKPETEDYCDILNRSFAYDVEAPEYPNQWRFVDDKPVCTAFWPHGMEDDPAHIVTDDRTIDMFSEPT